MLCRRVYTKHHLKFGKNQADDLVAVKNRFILDFGANFFLYFIGVWYYSALTFFFAGSSVRKGTANPMISITMPMIP